MQRGQGRGVVGDGVDFWKLRAGARERRRQRERGKAGRDDFSSESDRIARVRFRF